MKTQQNIGESIIEKIEEGLHIERESQGYWVVKQTVRDTEIIRTESRENAIEAGHALAEIANWGTTIDVMEHLRNNREDLYEKVLAVKAAYHAEPSVNGLYMQTLTEEGQVRYRIEDRGQFREVTGWHVVTGLAVHQKSFETWSIDHVASAQMLSEFDSKEKALLMADKIKNLLIWKDPDSAELIREYEELQNYLVNLKKAVVAGEELPSISEELEYQLIFLQFEKIRENWPIFLEAWRQLNDMVGLDNVKDQVRTLLGRIRGQMRNRGKVKEKRPMMHMVFAGPPGTGKTEVARIIARLFYALGVLRENKLVEVDSTNIIGTAYGQTEDQMKKLLDSAMGGGLFIDEAYSLATHGEKGFGQDAVNVLMKAMEDHRDDLFVILAGYTNDMARLLEMNEGFSSRIRHHLYFRDYTPAQLTEIGIRMIKSEGYRVTDDVKQALEKAIEGKTKQGVVPNNAREVRTMTENITDETLIRIGKDLEADGLLVTAADVKNATKQRLSINEQEGLIEIRQQALEELHTLVGMDELKEQVNKILNRLVIEKMKFEEDIITEKPRMHMVFAGPSGTGKTTVAKIIGKFLKGSGMLTSGHFRKVTRSDLVGSYQGHTAKAVRKQVNKAMGGVLFIDEAYNLVNGKGDTFGNEAVAELIDLMEENKDDLVVILAGYENRIEELFSHNEGFRSRIAHHFVFPNYSSDDIAEIVSIIAKKNHLHMADDVRERLSQSIREIGFANGGTFEGNGRWASKFVTKLRDAQTERLTEKGVDQLVKEDLITILEEDIDRAVQYL